MRKAYIADGECVREPRIFTQTALAIMLAFGIFEECEREKALKQLVELIHEKDDHFDTGVLGGRVLYRVLFNNGYEELAYKLITQKTHPSYAKMASYGTGTLWEEFLDLDEQTKTPKGGRGFGSLNHHFWGDISAVFYRDIAGIRINPALEDPHLIEIRPRFIKALDFAKARVPYMGGVVSVEWKRVGGKITVDVSAPSGCKVVKRYEE